jgi:hypothetical protein
MVRAPTLIKKKFFIYKDGAVAKSYMRKEKDFQIYEEMLKYVTIYEEPFSNI